MLLVSLTTACIAAAAGAYQLPQTYLYAILETEGGSVGQAVANRDGTVDLGPFQINSRWGPSLGRFWCITSNEALERVRDDGCANAVVASAILRGMVDETKGDLLVALGLYHSHSAKRAESYRDKILSAAKRF